MTGPELARAVDRLIDQVSHWSTSRWGVPSAAAGDAAAGSRADVAHGFAQRLADLEATVAGRRSRRVPRLPSDLSIPDQWRVLARDLVEADPDEEVLAAGARALLATRAALFPGT